MTAVAEQPTLDLGIVEVGSYVYVFHESGDPEGSGLVLSCIWNENGSLRSVVVSLTSGGRNVVRPAARVVLA